MRLLFALTLVVLILGGSSGCRTCGDRPRLFERLFHNDRDDCPSRSGREGASLGKPSSDFASRVGCGELPGSAMVPGGYAQLHTTPVSGSTPLYSAAPLNGFPSSPSLGFTNPLRDNELPMPASPRLPGMDVPTAPPSPANPNTGVPVPGNPGRFTAEPRK